MTIQSLSILLSLPAYLASCDGSFSEETLVYWELDGDSARPFHIGQHTALIWWWVLVCSLTWNAYFLNSHQASKSRNHASSSQGAMVQPASKESTLKKVRTALN